MELREIASRFDQNGYVHLPQVITGEELAILQEDSSHIINEGPAGKEPATDYFFDLLPNSGESIFHRVQYIFPKAKNNSFAKLLGHPYILSVVQQLLGNDFICGAEALVFKTPRNGKEVPIHCDCDPTDKNYSPFVFNVDFYLDDATAENGCLLVAPGSHKLNVTPAETNEKGFNFPGLVEVPVNAGDVLLHNTRLVHGSERNQSEALRRTLYYEFRALSVVSKQGMGTGLPVNETWINERLRLIMHSIDLRQATPYSQGEIPFRYESPTGFKVPWPQPHEAINYRPALGYNKFF